ncbi:RIIa domain-containing protein 1 [Clonorchis sinensis]|uniref:RIIa domain-containing protein 1 n=1 Tax=Clonorchis sinensis TaxID=79923 RepID=A0A8T1M8P4_CLOSI|nr:RIIa domain-containing protein 1 [Clonorchis sinensis]
MAAVDTGSAPPKHDPPFTMEAYDLGGPDKLGALRNDQQAATNRLKTETRINNEKYLREHPEIQFMISAFLRDLLLKQPEDPRKHFTDFFIRPDLRDQILQLEKEYYQKMEDDTTVRLLAGEHYDEANSSDEETPCMQSKVVKT